MMGIDMSNPPVSRTKNFFASPALSLTLAGVFVEEGGGESGGGSREEVADVSSGLERSEDDADAEGMLHEEGEEEDNQKNKRRKKYNRHTSEQIRVMEALFKDSPHPDDKQRQQLSKQLGLAPRQIKFWFQNRRTQIKAIQERQENSLLKSEMEKLREENRCMRNTIKKACCPNCGLPTPTRDATITTHEQQLRIENARLKSEVEKLRAAAGRGTMSPSSSCSAGYDQHEDRNSMDYYTGFFGIEKPRILEIVNAATDELTKMATAGEPLWVPSFETGRSILNYDEYVRDFFSPPHEAAAVDSGCGKVRRSIEASREMGVVFLDISTLVQAFMDVNKWMEMFPCMISKAATVDVICNGEGDDRNGAIQLMFAELQMLTPMVPTRELYFIRQCKQLSSDSWAVVDVSIDKLQDTIDTSIGKCRKRPSGCIIQDLRNGHCKVIWVEHLELQRTAVHTLYRSIVNSGLAFGAKHWMATLQLQCERLVFFMATNVPMKDSGRVATLAGRKSILKLGQRMTRNFCRAIGASSYHTWTKLSTKGGDGIRVASRKNLNEPGEPVGVILCAVSSVWLPVTPLVLFDFLKDDTRRNEWDIMSTGGPVKAIANLAKGQDRGNSVTLHAAKSNESSNMWILQDSCTNAFESMVVYAPVDIDGMQSVMKGCDSSNIAVLPSGFSILPDGIETRPLLISTSRMEERDTEGGSLLTAAFQVVANASPIAKPTMESVEAVSTLVSCILRNIKTSLKCEDG